MTNDERRNGGNRYTVLSNTPIAVARGLSAFYNESTLQRNNPNWRSTIDRFLFSIGRLTMTRKNYLKQHKQLTQHLKRAGVPYPRRVFWQMDPRSAQHYDTQIRTMQATVKRVKA